MTFDEIVQKLRMSNSSISDLELMKYRDLRGLHGETILHYCVIEGFCDVVAKLIDVGYSVDVYNNFKKTPLMESVILRNARMIILLREANADVNLLDSEGNSALHLAAEFSVENKIVDCLLTMRPNLKLRNSYGETFEDIKRGISFE
jgi:ankyrin repeat protein